MLLARSVDVFVEDLFMFRFVSFESEGKPLTLCGMSSLIFQLQARELWPSLCFDIFGNLNKSFNKRRMSPLPKQQQELNERQRND